tara:strand:- start:205 stop:381 length:177 start_codon:yes stop_codon:yes gene_type:complete
MNYIYDTNVFCGDCQEPTEINIENGLCRECQTIDSKKQLITFNEEFNRQLQEKYGKKS